MATVVVLADFTEQGLRNAKERISHVDDVLELAKKSGVTVKHMYWTLGWHDVVAVCEAPDNETATAFSLSVASRGNVRTETLRAFSFDEMKKIHGKMV
jgi:uncharacterized protein with GYD domain